VLATCVVLLVRLLLRPAQRQRLDTWARVSWWQLRQRAQGLRKRAPRGSARDAEREAQDAIRRAQQRAQGRKQADWDGNVARPRQFQDPKNRRNLH
jgi:hypothetical protein